jgi:hypothetical protein
MILSTTSKLELRCQTAECPGWLRLDLSKIEKAEIVNCDYGHRHLIKILDKRICNNTERYEIEIDPIDNPGSYL